MDQLFKDLLNAFGLNNDKCKVQALGQGHIHDTYFVDQCGENHPPLILQRINNFVFKDVGLLMQNMELVTAHIAFKNRKLKKDPARNGILLLEAEEGKSYIGNDEIGYWRMFWFIEGQKSFDVAENPEIAFEGGRVIAEFQSMLSDLDPEKVGDTIPRFHDLRGRMDQFNDSLKIASTERQDKAAELIEFSKNNAESNLELFDISEKGDVPVRLTHCDTKFNNILYGPDGKATCMIDLDTVMKGYSWFDFGDALRTCASIAPEDEEDVKKIGFRVEIFEGFARGYIAGAVGFLTKDEMSILHRAPIYFAYMQGLRFLTDYLNNDVYYKTEFPEHNFQRARAQFTLMERMIEQKDTMSDIISKAHTEFRS
jgi:hypothetical protein